MGNWFNKETRGSVMGIFSASSSFGDILGQQTGAFFAQFSNVEWEYIMITTTCYVLISAFLFLLVEEKPNESLLPQSNTIPLEPTIPDTEATLDAEKPKKKKGISFWKAWLLPG
jgi:sugar phosphate permease